MLASFIHDLMNLVIALAILRLVTIELLRRNPESPLGKALAFVIG